MTSLRMSTGRTKARASPKARARKVARCLWENSAPNAARNIMAHPTALCFVEMVINNLAKATLQTMIHTIGQKKLTRTTGRGAKVSPRVSDPKVESLVENLGDLAVANHAKAEVVVSDVASLADPSHVVLHHHTSAITIATLFGIPRCHLLPQPLHLVPRVLSATHKVHHCSPHTCPTMCQISTTQPLLHRLVLQPLTCLSGN